jgi:long-chain acyl-CoA synthetase
LGARTNGALGEGLPTSTRQERRARRDGPYLRAWCYNIHEQPRKASHHFYLGPRLRRTPLAVAGLHAWLAGRIFVAMNLSSAFGDSVRQRKEKTALFWGEREFSYQELWEHSVRFGQVLREQFGVNPGDRVGLWLKNCPEFIPSLFGTLKTGAVVVPINNFLKPNEVGFILQDAGIDLVITDAELAVHFEPLKAARPNLKLFQIETLPAEGSVRSSSATRIEPPVHERSMEDLAVIIYTSGTTGRPKGAMLSHGNLAHNIESCRIVLRTIDADRFAVVLPMFHSYMLTVGVMLPLMVGGSIVLVKSLHPPRNVLQEIFQRQATVLPAIPQFYRSMVSAPIQGSLPLRMCLSGAAPLPGQILKDFEAKFHIPLIEGYGLSEASPVVTKNPLDRTRKPGSIGLPIPNVQVSIQDEAGHHLGSREIGEVCVKGGNVMAGYWNHPEETAKVMRDGWLLTGDVGFRDEEGYYYITDRKKDMFLVNGMNVYPREIEELLYQYPGVKEAAVVAKPDARKGEQAIAFVSPNDGAVLEEKPLQDFLKQKLADYKLPRKIVLLPALPRNSTGKILKTDLRELAARESSAAQPGIQGVAGNATR